MKDQISSDRQPVVIVLGMDRSGTSLCTSVLQALGISLGSDLVPGDRFNDRGYFEDREILQVHERILALLGRSWDTLATVRPFPPVWWESEVLDGVYEELTEIAHARAAAAGSGIWGFKDPRTVLLLPLWQRVFQNLAMDPVFVVCVRHPAAVAQSLAAREGFPPLFSEMLWLEKTLGACLASWGAPNCLIHYEDWFVTPSKCVETLLQVTGVAMPQSAETLTEAVQSIVSRELRHDTQGETIESHTVEAFYRNLFGCSRVPNVEILNGLDAAMALATEFICSVEKIAGFKLLSGVHAPPYAYCTEQDFVAIQRASVDAIEFFRQHDPMLVRAQWMMAAENRKLGQSQEALDRAQKLVAERDARLKQHIAGLAQTDRLVILRAEERRAEAERAAGLESTLAALRDRFARLELQFVGLQDRAEELEKQGQDWAQRTRVLQADLRLHEDAILTNERALDVKNRALDQLRFEKSRVEANLRDRENEIAIHEQALRAKDHTLGELRHELFEVRSSLSWRFTLPMRAAASLTAKLHRSVLHFLYCTRAFRFAGKPLAKLISITNFTGASFLLPENPLFELEFYKRENGDVARRAKNLWAHYLGFGDDEKRNPHPLFDTRHYKAKYSDVVESGLNPLMHYSSFGALEKRNPHPYFDSAFYLERYADVRESKCNPLLHYWLYGRFEGRLSMDPGSILLRREKLP